MVFFTCNHCGESLKKNSVDKHYNAKCRRPKFLTCVDCVKDFRGEEYAAHTKCITEDEKYSAKGFKSRPSSNKGEKKQESWLQLMKDVSENRKDLPADQRRLLDQLLRHNNNNVPQKQAKFVNYVKNCSSQTPKMTIDLLWVALDAERTAQKEKEAKPESGKSGENRKENGTNGSENNTAPQQNKKEKKNKNKKAKMDGNSQEDVTNGNDVNSTEGLSGKTPYGSKKKKRDKRMKDGELPVEMETPDSSETHSKLKKKRKCEVEETPCDGISAMKKNKLNGEAEKSGEKFNWSNKIVKVLESADNKELLVKRLRKKVLAEFSSTTGKTVNESVYAMFTKKLSKIPVVQLKKGKAILKT